MNLPTRQLGSTGREVTALGLGGEGVLRTFGREREAYALVNRALDLGITYCPRSPSTRVSSRMSCRWR